MKDKHVTKKGHWLKQKYKIGIIQINQKIEKISETATEDT